MDARTAEVFGSPLTHVSLTVSLQMTAKRKSQDPEAEPDWGETSSRASLRAGVSRRSAGGRGRESSPVYLRRDAHPEFAAAWVDAAEARMDILRDTIFRRAVEGVIVHTDWEVNPETGERIKTSETRRFSDNLAI